MADKTKKVVYNFRPFSIPTLIFQIPTAMIGYHMHGSIFWAIMDFIFWPIVWAKWLILQEVNLTIIKDTFSFFLQ
jgi:hypothetical protein